ncbi:MAG: transglycosylase domain-containing protein [Turneriella sp.]
MSISASTSKAFCAFFKNLRAMRVVAGGSTITQQLVKGLYTESERTLFRKIYEAGISFCRSQPLQDEILEMYFNQTISGMVPMASRQRRSFILTNQYRS